MPVILDDVVVSLDREHRGMIVDLLQKEFADRQVVLFTHDREWFAELRSMLDPATWDFHALRPYGGPDQGIAWSTKGTGFDDARAYLDTAPDIAGNITRKIMDTELGLIAEKLKLRMEYKHGLKNDHRMAHDFLVALSKASKSAFQRRAADGQYEPSKEVTDLLVETDRLLIAWGNRASHTFDLVKAEATKLLAKCEETLQVFECDTCKKSIFRFDDSNSVKQCQCGACRWRYDKA